MYDHLAVISDWFRELVVPWRFPKRVQNCSIHRRTLATESYSLHFTIGKGPHSMCRQAGSRVSTTTRALSVLIQNPVVPIISPRRTPRGFELADVRLFKTADFDDSRSGSLRTAIGTPWCLRFALWKRPPVSSR